MVIGVAQNKPEKAPKDQAEADLINSVMKDPDASNRLKSLEKWTKDYPETAYAPERQQFFLVTYQQLNRTKDAFATAQDVLKTNPNDELALRTIISAMYVFNPPTARNSTPPRRPALTFSVTSMQFTPLTKSLRRRPRRTGKS